MLIKSNLSALNLPIAMINISDGFSAWCFCTSALQPQVITSSINHALYAMILEATSYFLTIMTTRLR